MKTAAITTERINFETQQEARDFLVVVNKTCKENNLINDSIEREEKTIIIKDTRADLLIQIGMNYEKFKQSIENKYK